MRAYEHLYFHGLTRLLVEGRVIEVTHYTEQKERNSMF
jgi:hypothetical protein